MQITLPDVRCIVGGGTVASGTLSTVVLGPINLYDYNHKSFTLYNYSATTLSGAVIQVNPDHQGQEFPTPAGISTASQYGPNPGLWENYDTTAFQNLASGAVKSLNIPGDVHKWFRVVGTSNQPGSTTVTCSGWCYARSI